MSVNGVSECYSFAAMSKSQVDAYNYTLGLLSLAFLAVAWICSNLFGPIGFIVANCFNFSFRIFHNFNVIRKRKDSLSDPLVENLWPKSGTLIMIFISTVICSVSEHFIYNPSLLKNIAIHLSIGLITFSASTLTVITNEPVIKMQVMKIFKIHTS